MADPNLPTESGKYGQQYRRVNRQHLHPVHGVGRVNGQVPPQTGIYDQLPDEDPPMKQNWYRPPQDKEPAMKHQWAWSNNWFTSRTPQYNGNFGQSPSMVGTRTGGQHRLNTHKGHAARPLIKYPKQYKTPGSRHY